MDAPRELFALESLNGKIWVHSTKGPLVFEELEDAQAALLANKGKLEKKHSVIIVAMKPDLSSAPFIDYHRDESDMMKMPANSIYLSDLRDKVMQSQNKDVVGSIEPENAEDAEYLELRAKLKELGVNVRAIRKLPRLRTMLAEAEAAVTEPVNA